MNAPVSRRSFLTSASAAAAAATTFPAAALPPDDQPVSPQPFKLISAADFAHSAATVELHPGNFSLLENTPLPVTAVMTCEENHAAKEFEWHEGRDHLVQVLDGSTRYQIGGTPQMRRNTRPGEWLAPESTGATTLTLGPGDWLIIPRGQPHKRSTDTSVTFVLISTVGPLLK